MRKELKKIEKMVDNDPKLKEELENVAKSNAELKKTLEAFCKRNPDHVLCNDQKLYEKTTKQVRRIR
jgi:F0F1-type ATP synthase delta subunit